MQFIRPKVDHRARVRVMSLGGFGNVTTNMFVYEFLPSGEILLVDCGIGFPSEEMLGVDLLIPDISYLKDKKEKIKGLILTHGHDDHTGALPYILPQLSFPVYTSSPLTAGFAELRMIEAGLTQRVTIVDVDKTLKLGPFSVEFIRINHSTPDAQHLFISTPAGNLYHGPDYKFDFTPVDGKKPDLVKIARMGMNGVTLMLTDCLGSEHKEATPSESTLEEMFDRELSHWKGRIIVTTISSNISRFIQAIEAAVKYGRRVALVGRSLEKKIELATKLGYMKFDRKIYLTPEQANRNPDNQIMLLVSGSQGQPGSALDRIATSEHKHVTIRKDDKVIFSSPDYIPGTEGATHNLIDRLTSLGATVMYGGIANDLHVGGHGGQHDMMLLLNLVKPRYVVPIGGELRHMKQYSLMAKRMGFGDEQILTPTDGQIIEMAANGKVIINGKLEVRNVMVDGLGVGDVGNVVLRDRQVLSAEGIVIIVLQLDRINGKIIDNPDVISRGFVYARGNEALIGQARGEIKKALGSRDKLDAHTARELVVDRMERWFWNQTGRRPMVLPVVVEV